MKVFVCCLFVTITIENWNKFHQILLLLTPLHQTKYTKLFKCDFSFSWTTFKTRCQNHMMTKSARMDRNI